MLNNQRGSIVTKLILFFFVSAIVYGVSYSFISKMLPADAATMTSTIFALIAFTLMFVLDLITSRGDKKRKK
jgi:uncharacterized membrane protein (DUF485 family)